MTRVFVIAEAGVNHNGSLALAMKMIDAAKKAGADAVKFQSFKTSSMTTTKAPRAAYTRRTNASTESQWAMLRRLELDEKAQRALAKRCRARGIAFMSSPFDVESAVFLRGLRMPAFKIPSGEITNLPYLRKIGSFKQKIFLSTGMSTLQEVRAAVDVLVHAGTKRRDITLLHCTTEYPAPFQEVNLKAMGTLQKVLGLPVGYSDHTPGTEVAVAATALGATVIEKHFTLDRKMRGPDHLASLEPEAFCRMVTSIRHVEAALGSAVKKPSPSELKNKIVRKSLVAARWIQKGERFTENNVTAKRPGTGLSPMLWDRVMGRVAKKTFAPEERIRL